MKNYKHKQGQKDRAKILAAITIIIDTVDSSDLKPDSDFAAFYDKIKEAQELGMPILEKVYRDKALSSSTFINDLANKFDWYFKKLYKL